MKWRSWVDFDPKDYTFQGIPENKTEVKVSVLRSGGISGELKVNYSTEEVNIQRHEHIVAARIDIGKTRSHVCTIQLLIVDTL